MTPALIQLVALCASLNVCFAAPVAAKKFEAYEIAVDGDGRASLKVGGELLSDSIGPYIPRSWKTARDVEVKQEVVADGATVITFTGRRNTKLVDFDFVHRFTCRPDQLTLEYVFGVRKIRNAVQIANWYIHIQPDTAMGHSFVFPDGRKMIYPEELGDRKLWSGTYQSAGPCAVTMVGFNGVDVTMDWRECGKVEVYDWGSPHQ